MADELHICTWNRTKKPLAIAWSGAGWGGDTVGGDLTNVQYKPIWNCHNESSLCKEYILMKRILKS
jgi:hypothetical protein